jgi:hypothetical protein
VYLAAGSLSVVRNVFGMTGIGLILAQATGGLVAWIGPLGFTAISQFALVANYSEPLTWPTRSPTDLGGWIAAMVVFAVGLGVHTIRDPKSTRRVRYAWPVRKRNFAMNIAPASGKWAR